MQTHNTSPQGPERSWIQNQDESSVPYIPDTFQLMYLKYLTVFGKFTYLEDDWVQFKIQKAGCGQYGTNELTVK